MRITNSSVELSASASYAEKHVREESLRIWRGNTRPDFKDENDGITQRELLYADILEISEKAKKALEEQIAKGGGIVSGDSIPTNKVQAADRQALLTNKDELKLLLVRKMIEVLTGKKLKFVLPDKSVMEKVRLADPPSDSGITISLVPARAGWGLEYDFRETYFESQSLTFLSRGVVKTADGREISFSVNLNMSRSFFSQTNLSIRAGDAKLVDPLVISFGGGAPQLTEEKFFFDIDNDGDPDQVSFVTGGSGFLALDRNNDGIINNGSELFGPQTGNGFSELLVYDSDNNNWIDENDPIYDKLRIWTKDENGNDVLLALGQMGVGAIYLGSVSTPYSLKGADNSLLGNIGQTGIYLNENGTAGTIMHIDLAV